MIIINKPYIKELDDKTVLLCDIEIDGSKKEIFFEVEKKYGKYLCYERGDAYLIGYLNWAMRFGHDIISIAPITEELLYNINEYLIPSLCNHDKNLHRIHIKAATDSTILPSAGAVGTGISCGIDSFHAIFNNINNKYSSLKLTHLFIFSVGSFNIKRYEKFGFEKVKNKIYTKAQNIAEELNIPLITSNSNFRYTKIRNYDLIHTYCSMFAIYCMQKLWKTYFYGSMGYDYSKFLLENNSEHPSGYYELLSLQCFSTSSLRIYSEGATKSRLEKTKSIVNYPLVQKMLHVCWTKDINCGLCPKCKRTLLTLDALGELDNFNESFNINYYKQNRAKYIYWLYVKHRQADIMLEPVYEILKKDISLIMRLNYWSKFILKRLFSIKYERNHIIIRLLGLKLSFKIGNKNDEVYRDN